MTKSKTINGTAKKKKTINPRSPGAAAIELGRRIKVRRVEINMSQAELGDQLGLSFQQIQKYEKGINRVGASRMGDVAKALQVPITFFYGDEKKPTEIEVESLLFADPAYNLRLLRAYAKIGAVEGTVEVQRQFVVLMEGVASIIGMNVEGG